MTSETQPTVTWSMAVSLSERDVEAIFENLVLGPLGYSPAQLDRQPDFADYVLLERDLKIAIVEIKGWEAFHISDNQRKALEQAAGYAGRHRCKNIMAFDGRVMVLAECQQDSISVLFEIPVDTADPVDELFYFTEYGLSKLPGKCVFGMYLILHLLFQKSNKSSELKKT